MLKSNFKKFVSVISVAAMLGSLAIPAVYADDDAADTTVEDSAQLMATGDLISSDNFDDLSEETLISYKKYDTAAEVVDQDPYTGLSTMNLYVGTGTQSDNESTGFSIADGVGVDGSKALVLNSGKAARSTSGGRIEFKKPSSDDNFVITFKVYPTTRQKLNLGDSTSDASDVNALTLNTGEWNEVEIYVSRSGSSAGRLINVNGETDSTISRTVGEAPVMWGAQSNNVGAMYFDDIEVRVIASVPTPIPTPTPRPAKTMDIGDINDFDDELNFLEGSGTSGTTIIKLGAAQEPSTAVAGMSIGIGTRTDGGTTAVNIGTGKEGNGLHMYSGNFSTSSRGPRITLLEPANENNVDYKVSFDATKTADGNDLFFNSSSSSFGGSAAGLVTDQWSVVEIYMAGGMQIVFVDGTFIKSEATTSLPVLWSKDSNEVGDIVIDNYKIEAVDAESVVKAAAGSVDITTDDETVYLGSDDKYNCITSFSIPNSVIGNEANWEVSEKAEDGSWVSTSDVKLSNGTASFTSTVSDEKDYKLTVTVTDGTYSAQKEFILNYVKSENVVQTIIDQLSFPDSALDDTEYTSSSANIKYEDGVYHISGDFSVPLTKWVATIGWQVTDTQTIQIDKDGDAKVFPINTDTMTLTATVSYQGESMKKEFPISVLRYNKSKLTYVEDQLGDTPIYPNGTDGEALTYVTLLQNGTATIPFDVAFKTIAAEDQNLAISWKTSDESVLSDEGVIAVNDMDAHPVTLTKTVTYTIDGVEIISKSVDYSVNVQFNPNTMQSSIEETVKKYAESKSTDTESSTYIAAYNRGMEILSDRYKTRGDANYEANFTSIPSSVDDDFTLPVEGAFGSEISWTSSNTAIKINDEKATVTRPSSDRDVTLTATFTSGASTNLKAYSTVVEVEGTGRSSGSSGGSSSSGGGNSYRSTLGTSTTTTTTATTPVPTVTAAPAEEADGFTDLGSVEWAQTAINALADKGIVSGRDASTFAPNDNITRAEFAKILVGAFGIETGAEADFTDVDSSAWYAEYVGACYAAGIITGYEDGTFRPNDLVTRQDMAVMVTRAASVKDITIDTPNDGVEFTDDADISEYASDAVETLQKAGIINGMEDGSFAPKATATRAQAAKILYTFCD